MVSCRLQNHEDPGGLKEEREEEEEKTMKKVSFIIIILIRCSGSDPRILLVLKVLFLMAVKIICR